MKFLIKIGIIFFSSECLSKSVDSDSSLMSLELNFGIRKISCYDVFQEGKGPFNRNRIYSSSILLNKNIYTLRKNYFVGSIGLNYRLYECSLASNNSLLPNINSDVTSSVNMLGFQNSISIWRNLLKTKKISLDANIGVSTSGIFSSANKTNSYVFQHIQSFGYDSVVLKFKRNNIFYISEIIGLRVSAMNSKVAIGLKYLSKPSISTTNIEYEIIDTRAPIGYYLYKGFFLDNYRMLEFYLEYKI